jgi:hypothetical protein
VHRLQTKMEILLATAILFILALISDTVADEASARCLSSPSLCLSESMYDSHFEFNKFATRADTPPPIGDDADWAAARCRGERLLYVMKLTDQDEASKVLQWPHVQSPWDGDLKNELALWGYSEEERPDRCDFEYNEFTTPFEALNIDPSSVAEGGGNTCYKFRHYNGPTVEKTPDGKLPDKYIQKYKVDGKEYRVSAICACVFLRVADMSF